MAIVAYRLYSSVCSFSKNSHAPVSSNVATDGGPSKAESPIPHFPMAMYYALRILTKGCGSPDHSSFTKFSTSRCDTLGCFPFGLLLFVILPQLLRREGEAMRDEGCDDVYYQRQWKENNDANNCCVVRWWRWMNIRFICNSILSCWIRWEIVMSLYRRNCTFQHYCYGLYLPWFHHDTSQYEYDVRKCRRGLMAVWCCLSWTLGRQLRWQWGRNAAALPPVKKDTER